MRKFLTVVLMAATTLSVTAVFAQQAAAPAAQGKTTRPAPKAKKLSRAEVDSWLAKPSESVFIDVRRPDEVSANGGFPVYLSIQANDLANHLGDIPKDKTIITVSNHAARAGVAADLLDSKGFKVAGAVGVEDYESEGGKALHIPVPPPRPATATATK